MNCVRSKDVHKQLAHVKWRQNGIQVDSRLKSQKKLKAGVNLNGIFASLNTGLRQISRSHFKQSKNSMNLCYRLFCKYLADFWVYLDGDSFS